MKTKKINWDIVENNIVEARKELENLERKIKNRRQKRLGEIEFQISLQHAYHHVNFAWNIRHQPTSAYVQLTDSHFRKWGQFPKDIWFED